MTVEQMTQICGVTLQAYARQLSVEFNDLPLLQQVLLKLVQFCLKRPQDITPAMVYNHWMGLQIRSGTRYVPESSGPLPAVNLQQRGSPPLLQYHQLTAERKMLFRLIVSLVRQMQEMVEEAVCHCTSPCTHCRCRGKAGACTQT